MGLRLSLGLAVAALLALSPAAQAADLEETDRLAIAAYRSCLGGDAELGALQVLRAAADDLVAEAGGHGEVLALRSMSRAAFAVRADGACAVVFADDLKDPKARQSALALLRNAQGQAPPDRAPTPPLAPGFTAIATPGFTPIAAVRPALAPPATPTPQFAPHSAVRALMDVCGAGLVAGDVRAAVAALGAEEGPKTYGLPNTADGAAVHRVASRDGEVWLYVRPDDPTCHIAVAMAPPQSSALMLDLMKKEGLLAGAAGQVDANTSYQQFASADGKLWANLVTFSPPPGVLATHVRTYVQMGAH